MKKRIIILSVIFFTIILFSYYVFSKINRFRFYGSEMGIETMTLSFGSLVNYAYVYSEIPDTQKFFKYLKEISSQENEIFPEGFHKSLVKLNPSDFIFTTDYTYIYVWLFSEIVDGKDTLYFVDVPLKDFLLRRSRLVAQYPYPNPCRPELIYFEKDRKSFQNQDLYDKLSGIIREIAHFQFTGNQIENPFNLCCFHIFFKGDEMVIENFDSFLQDQCRLDKELENEILKRLSFLKELYAGYDFYIQFYVDGNRKMKQ